MRLWILSDIHTRRDRLWKPSAKPEFDILVVAGDVFDADIRRSIIWSDHVADGRPAVFVPGNHEFWNRTIENEIEFAEHFASTRNVTLLTGQGWVEVAGGHFAGGTLWTDFRLNQLGGAILFPAELSEPIYVRDVSIDRRATGPDIAARYHTEVAALEKALDPEHLPTGPRIVVTHYAPHPGVLPREIWTDPVAAASASDLSHLTDVGSAHLWVCGHVHQSVDFVPSYGTTIICNPRGEDGSNADFIEDLVIEVGASGSLSRA